MSTTSVEERDSRRLGLGGRYGPVQPRPTLVSPKPLWPGMPALFIQTSGQLLEAQVVAEVGAATGMGVLHEVRMNAGRERNRRIKRLTKIQTTMGLDPRDMLLDRALYRGTKHRKYAREHTLDHAWCQQQWDAGCRYALTDSGYIPAGDTEGLKRTLGQGQDVDGNTIGVLALANEWFTVDSGIVASEIGKAGIPVAVIGENDYDPFDTKAAVEGLLEIVHAPVPVFPMRVDQAGLGAIAYGAGGCMIGTSTGRRHLSPVRSGFVPMTPGGPEVATYVRAGMKYRTMKNIRDAIALTVVEHPEWWICEGPCCRGRSIGRIVTKEEAFEHALYALAEQAKELIDLPDVPSRRRAWAKMCQDAQMMNMAVHDTGMKSWKEPGFLGGWINALSSRT